MLKHRAAQALAAGAKQHHRALIRTDFEALSRHLLEPLALAPARHHLLMIKTLERAIAGELRRVMLLMPPGSAKSIYGSQLFPIYWFARYPRANIMCASHTAELADGFGRKVRNYVDENEHDLGFGLRRDSRAAGRWETTKGGEYFATGVDGAASGRRADLLVIDDPVKGRKEADSEVDRETVWNFYRSTLYPRLKPRAAVVLIMTRWHEDDLGGRLLAEAAVGGDQWHVLKLPAFAEEDDPLGRAPGEPLWPEWESAEELRAKEHVLGPRDWIALFQQSPRPLEGSLFQVGKITVVQSIPAGCTWVRAWDLAATAEAGTRDADWTVGLKLGRTPLGRFIVADVRRDRVGPDGVMSMIANTASQDGNGVAISIPQDPGQAGKAQAQQIVRMLHGYRVMTSPETGAKATRAMGIISQCNAGNLDMLDGPWNRRFIEELAGFPNGRKDDQVDALARAATHPLMGRRKMTISKAAIANASARRTLGQPAPPS